MRIIMRYDPGDKKSRMTYADEEVVRGLAEYSLEYGDEGPILFFAEVSTDAI